MALVDGPPTLLGFGMTVMPLSGLSATPDGSFASSAPGNRTSPPTLCWIQQDVLREPAQQRGPTDIPLERIFLSRFRPQE
ncbi:hypothetical protein [Arthrobacter sp. IK3]|uniref:hypothetical protein n=1 Tax=Arthrobacter sp. IK3 TaxID=3448169 RepID=UPI003EE30BEC